MTKRAALILAGGSAQRFQAQNQPWQDKARAEIAGKPLLVHVAQNISGVVDEVAVCVNSEERKVQYGQVLKEYGLHVKLVVDQKSCTIGGPLIAIMSGLYSVTANTCLTVPVDMPFLKPQVADYLFHAIEGVDVANPMWPDGTLETLVMTLDRKICLEIAKTLCAFNKSRTDSIIRGASKLHLVSPLKEIKTLDPGLISFININSQQDLTQPKTRSIEGKITENLRFNKGDLKSSDLQRLRDGLRFITKGNLAEAQTVFASCADNFEAQNSHFWAGVSIEKLAEAMQKQSTAKTKDAYLQAANHYLSEAKVYEEKGCKLLADRALADKAWCEKRV